MNVRLFVEVGFEASHSTDHLLAMRLAIMSHLDHDREQLPVFVDETFVNWDAARRGRGFQLLRELSVTRQVFVMTCHEPWAKELIDAGANRVELT